ncbi:MAG: carboxy terminal-processing peptidase [Sphingobacteriales bacterium]|nr:carboxy terminal-processing peptidase [Sphingobacteriales bacterium]
MKLISLLFVGMIASAAGFYQMFNGAAVADDGNVLYAATKKEKVLMQVIEESLQRTHYQAPQINDEFSAKAFDLYLKRLDYGKRFLLESDVKYLEKYRYKVDDAIINKNFDLYYEANEILKKRIAEAETYYQEILCKPFDFTQNERVNMDYDKKTYAKNTAELKDEWYKLLKYQTMTRVLGKLENQEEAAEKKDTTVKIKVFAELESDARDKILHNYENYFSRIHKNDDNDRLSTYLNAIVSVYDTHSSYFPPEDKKNFDIKLSGQLEGIGATLQEEDGFIKVVSIVPGSPSWKQGELKVDDVIVEVAQGDAEPVEITDMKLDDAVQLIRGKKGTEVRLTVKKRDGNIVKIPIIRDVVIIEETYAKSAVIESNNAKIGYIYLPKFYADLNHTGGRSCADDIRQELLKLKNDAVDAIVFDLYDNGGGSLDDVVRMLGWFIKDGPVVQVKAPDGNSRTLADRDPSVIYEGPLVVMVNGQSASASEIFAAAVQDYQRGVVVGTASTYGKGTVQRFLDLDNILVQGYDDIKPIGSLKVTIQKFYRINGGSTQLKGVVPDIVLPDAYKYILSGEKEEDYALQWDEIEAARYEAFPRTYNLNQLKNMSAVRVAANPFFQQVEKTALRFQEEDKAKSYALNLEQYRQERSQAKSEEKIYDQLKENSDSLHIMATAADHLAMEKDSANADRYEAFFEDMQKNFYIREAIEVAKDMAGKGNALIDK